MVTRCVVTFQSAVAGLALLFATGARGQDSAPTPAAAPAAAPETPASPVEVPSQEATVATPPAPQAGASAVPDGASPLPCAAAPTKKSKARMRIPLPPELQGEVRVLELKGAWVGKKLPPLRPWVMKDLRSGHTTAIGNGVGLSGFGATFGVASEHVERAFEFSLAREDAPAATGIPVRCEWEGGSDSFGGGSGVGAGMRYPRPNTILCEFFDAPEAEPWRLRLYVGRPSNPINPEFYGRGALARGETTYKATVTNETIPSVLGLRAPMVTGTFFWKEKRVVAAVERLVPGRIVLSCATSPEEQSLFVAVGAALLFRDLEAWSLEH